MPVVKRAEAIERLALFAEKAKPGQLREFYGELFPEKAITVTPNAIELAKRIRQGLLVEELIDLWNVAFPSDRNVWFDEETELVHINEELVGFAETD